jgi:hypothetical protein
MPVGAQVVGQAIGISRIRLRSGGTPAGSGGGKSVGVDRVDRVAGGEEPLDQEPVGSLDDHLRSEPVGGPDGGRRGLMKDRG